MSPSARVFAAAVFLLTVAIVAPASTLRAQQQQPDEPLSLPSAGVTWPSPLKQVDPLYTEAAKQAKIEGVVRLKAVVEKDGSVDRIQIIKSLDNQYGLDDAAVSAAAKWQFQPAKKDGKPIAAWIELEMDFRLH